MAKARPLDGEPDGTWTPARSPASPHVRHHAADVVRSAGPRATLFRITHDHTVVQPMIDEGRLTAEEAVSRPV